jgi:hypothetical protein
MIMKIWKDPVWSKVIATAIILLIGSVVTYLTGAWPGIVKYFNSAFEFLNLSSPVKNWLIGIVLIPWLLVGYGICIIFAEKFRKKSLV